MSTKENLAINFGRQGQIVPLSIVTSKEDFNKFYSNFIEASWDNQVLAVANFLSLPVSTCLTDKRLLLIDNTNGKKLGHDSLFGFITSDRTHMGIGMKWEEWVLHVNAMTQKLEFGINSKSPKDVLLQIDDVTKALGRPPVSKFEFNLAKDQIIHEQVNKMQSEYQTTVSNMNGKVSSLMRQLEGERRDKLEAIEKLESALSEINKLASKEEQVDLKNYVEVSIYNKIVDELSELKSKHEDVIHSYLSKLSKLTLLNEEQVEKINLLQRLIQRRNEEISAISSGQRTGTNEHAEIEAYAKEINRLKTQVIDLLKKNIYKQNVINKQKVISAKKSQINAILREKNNKKGTIEKNKAVETNRPKHHNKEVSTLSLLSLGLIASGAFLTSLYLFF